MLTAARSFCTQHPPHSQHPHAEPRIAQHSAVWRVLDGHRPWPSCSRSSGAPTARPPHWPQPLTFQGAVVLSGFPGPVPLGQAAVPLPAPSHAWPGLPLVSGCPTVDACPLWITWVLAFGEAEVFRLLSFDVRYRLLCAATFMPVCSASDVPRR